jgi:basic membrane protein A
VKRYLTRLPAMAAAVCSLAMLAACGSDEEESAGTQPAESEKKLKAAMVTDIGGLNDRSFNQLAYDGLKAAKSQYGVDIRAVTSQKNSDYVPNLSALARQKYDVIFAVGFLMADATAKVAKSFPNTNFAIIDSSALELKGKPKNVQGLLFKENEAGYLAGYMAGLYVKEKGGEQVISSVGGRRSRPSTATSPATGGRQGGQPGDQDLNGYSQDFVDQAKCKELALNQIEEGSQVVFQVAGQCGLGAIDAAKEENVQAIGVDADQAYIGPQVLTSALKKIDEAVLQTIKDTQADKFQAGTDRSSTRSPTGSGSGRSTPRARVPLAGAGRAEEDRRGRDQGHPGRSQVGRVMSSEFRAAMAEGRDPQLAHELRGITKRFGAVVANDGGRPRPAQEERCRPPRRERGGQVDADEASSLACTSPTRARDPPRGRAGAYRLAAERWRLGIGMVHQHFLLVRS